MNTEKADDGYFMDIAYRLAQNSSKCVRRKIGSVIVRDDFIIAGGVNGAPNGMPRCTKSKGKYQCLKNLYGLKYQLGDIYCRGIHAELAAIVLAATMGVSVIDSTLYTTTRPCFQCTKAIINSGIKRVVWHLDYPLKEAISMQEDCSVDFQKITGYHKKGGYASCRQALGQGNLACK